MTIKTNDQKTTEEAEADEAEAQKKVEEDGKSEADKKVDDGRQKADEKGVSDEVAKLLKEQMKTKERLRAAEEEAAKRAKALEAYEGVDPAEYRKLVEEKKKADLAELERKGEYDRIIQQVREESNKKLSVVEEELQKVRDELARANESVKKMSIGNSFASSRFISEELVLSPAKVEALYGAHFDITDDGIVAYDKPRGAKERTPLVDASGSPMAFEAALEKIVRADSDFERIAKSKMKPGAKSATTDDEKTQPKLTGQNAILAGLAALKK